MNIIDFYNSNRDSIENNSADKCWQLGFEHSKNIERSLDIDITLNSEGNITREDLKCGIISNILTASNIIYNKEIQKGANVLITNISVAVELQSEFMYEPISSTKYECNFLNQYCAYPIGTLAGITVYVDPLMSGVDYRCLVGRDDENAEKLDYHNFFAFNVNLKRNDNEL